MNNVRLVIFLFVIGFVMIIIDLPYIYVIIYFVTAIYFLIMNKRVKEEKRENFRVNINKNNVKISRQHFRNNVGFRNREQYTDLFGEV